MISLGFGGHSDRVDPAMLHRIEAKLDLILAHLGLEYRDQAGAGLGDEVRRLADSGLKIEAIKAHREATGAGLKEAKDAVEGYMAGRG